MPSFLDRFRASKDEPESSSEDAASKAPPSDNESTLTQITNEATSYLEAVAKKMVDLADDFARGRYNRSQFEELYKHYVDEREAIERLMAAQPRSWKEGKTEGESVIIRRTHAARPLGYAIYHNATLQTLRTMGEFQVNNEVLAATLSRIRSSTEEVLGTELKSTEVESGRWMCFVPAQFTTLAVLFSVEPARLQMQMLEQLHGHFERANKHVLTAKTPNPAKLVYPHAAAFE